MGGGLEDQEYGLLDRIDLAYNVLVAVQALGIGSSNPDMAKWMEENPHLSKLYAWVLELRDANRTD